MKKLVFKTNIKCTGCLSKVSPVLDAEKGIQEWEVDLESENRTLTVQTSELNAEEVKKAVEKGGFSAEEV